MKSYDAIGISAEEESVQSFKSCFNVAHIDGSMTEYQNRVFPSACRTFLNLFF